MAYAETADVVARAGRFSKAWTDVSTPNYDDIERFLRTRAAEIDSALQGQGITPPATGTSAEALRSLNAAGALILLLGATALGASAEAVDVLYDRAQKEWDEGLSSILTGTHSAVVAIEATAEGETPGTATDFWSEEPGYGLEPVPAENPYLAPEFQRGEPF